MLQGKRFRELRLVRRLTHEELAEQLSLSTKQIWRYESGDTDPSGEIIAKIAKVFNVSADYLLGLTDNPNSALSENDLSEAERYIIAVLRRGEKLDAIRAIVADQ